MSHSCYGVPLATLRTECKRLSGGSGMDPIRVIPTSSRWASLKRGTSHSCGRLLSMDMHFMLSIPLFLIIACFALVQVACYIAVKLLVKVVEEGLTSASIRSRKRSMREAPTYAEYTAHAEALDVATNRSRWRNKKQDRFYDWKAIEKTISDLKHGQKSGDIEGLLATLGVCLNPKFGGVLREELYSKTYYGTKLLIDEYLDEVEAACSYLEQSAKKLNALGTNGSELSMIRQAAIEYNAQWGLSSLVLSGGAMLGLQHLGAVEVLLSENLVPKVICGTSAGAAVAGWLCTRTDEELAAQLNTEYIFDRFKVFPPLSWVKRFVNLWRNGYVSDIASWQSRGLYLWGDITFAEAFRKTGRILNISLTRADREHTTVVLNYRNAPNVMVYSAILASSAFPLLVPPLGLKERDANGDAVDATHLLGSFFHDGSLQEDVPCALLKESWGVRYNVVSQVNLHVFPFCGLRAHGEAGLPVSWRGGAGHWRAGFVLSALEVFFKENLRFLFRLMALLDVSPTYQGINFAKIAIQSYIGDITIHPRKFSIWHPLYLAADVSRAALDWLLQEGRLMVYPKISLIKSRLRIENAIEKLLRGAFCLDDPASRVDPIAMNGQSPTLISALAARLTAAAGYQPTNTNADKTVSVYPHPNSLQTCDTHEGSSDELLLDTALETASS